MIGGNHTVSIGAFRAVSGKYSNLTILQLDAHSDLRQSYEGSPFEPRMCSSQGQGVCTTVQVGIRSMAAEELPFADSGRIFYAHELYHSKELYDRALNLLSENVWITLDLDVFDPSVMPSTGTLSRADLTIVS